MTLPVTRQFELYMDLVRQLELKHGLIIIPVHFDVWQSMSAIGRLNLFQALSKILDSLDK